VTAEDFRRMALSFPETTESSHMDHPDFRVCGKIFATLAYPSDGLGMVKLLPEQQQEFVHDHPKIFVPVKAATKTVLRPALIAAWSNTAPKRVAAKFTGRE